MSVRLVVMRAPSSTWPRCRFHGRVKKTVWVNRVEVCSRKDHIGRQNGVICGKPIERVPTL